MGVRSAKLRPISMKVFLIMIFNEAPLSINVLGTMCHHKDEADVFCGVPVGAGLDLRVVIR
jgi:hypothetical protein